MEQRKQEIESLKASFAFFFYLWLAGNEGMEKKMETTIECRV